jgi:phosphoglucosamine mutase
MRFGTDGVRGVANVDLDAQSVLALGRATARVLGSGSFLVGRDTRRSGPMLQAAFSAGLACEGSDVTDVGVLPTPALAWLSEQRQVPAAVVSASHNPFSDNGIKVFASGGLKLPSSTEAEIERELDGLLAEQRLPGPAGEAVGSIDTDRHAAGSYVDRLVALLGDRPPLGGMKVLLDCANGAGSVVGPLALTRLGADVETIACDPDGLNINEGCGATHPEHLASEVRARGAEVGLALDGDADRLIAVDHTGRVATGDELMALFASDLEDSGELRGGVVVTVMSNLGFRRAMEGLGVEVTETPVGDRHVLEALEAKGLVLGGEQSGHIVFRHLATTGDGLLTGILLLDLVRRSGRSLADSINGSMQRLPQLLANVTVPDPRSVVEAEAVRAELASVERWLGDRGRVLLRVSGTEPLVRVMAEAFDESSAREALDRLCEAVSKAGAAETAAAP